MRFCFVVVVVIVVAVLVVVVAVVVAVVVIVVAVAIGAYCRELPLRMHCSGWPQEHEWPGLSLSTTMVP